MFLSANQLTALNKGPWFIALAGGETALLSTIIFWTDLPDMPSGVGGTGVGLYLALLAGIAVLALAWMNRSTGYTISGGFDAMKTDLNQRMNPDRSDDRPEKNDRPL